MDALNLARHAGLTWWRNWLALTVLNLVWMVSWLTVVLGPPVTLAVYSYMERLVAGDDMTPREFVTAVTANFAKGWLWALPVLASLAGWVVAVSFYALVGDVWARAAEVAVSLIVLTWLFVQFYALPFLFVQEQRSLRQALRNGALTAVASPLYSMIMAIMLLVVLLLSVRFMGLTFFFTPVLTAVAGTLAVRDRLQRFGVLESA